MLTFFAASLQASAPAAHYDVTTLSGARGRAAQVHVTLELTGDRDGETVLVLPGEWGGERELWRGVAGLTVSGGEIEQADPEAPTLRTVRHAPGAPLTVSWSVVQDREGEPTAAAGDNYRAWIRPDYVHMIGHTIFITPLGGVTGPVSVNLDAPEDWTLASDLQEGADSLSDVRQSIIVAGDFRISTLDVAGERVAVRGDMDDAQIISAMEAAARGNLTYWEEELMEWADAYASGAGSPYLVTGLPLIAEEGRSSFGGTNLFDSFALFGTGNTPPEILQRILVHEHAHSWVPARVGGLPDGEEEASGYWFSEGFTDFVTTRAGLLGGA